MVDLAGNIFILNNIDQGPCDLHDSVVISGVVTDTQLVSTTMPDTHPEVTRKDSLEEFLIGLWVKINRYLD